MSLASCLTIPDRGRRRLQRYVELLRRLPPEQLDAVLRGYPDVLGTSRVANRLFKGWHSLKETRATWEVPIAEAHFAIDALAEEPEFKASVERADFAGSPDDAIYTLKEVCQALLYDKRGEAEADVDALYGPFEPIAPWDQLGRIRPEPEPPEI